MPFLIQRPSAPRKIVWPEDNALAVPQREEFPDDADGALAFAAARDKWNAAWEEYQRTYDPATLPRRNGVEPTIFLVGSLRPEAQDFIRNEGIVKGPGFEIGATLAYGIVDIVNLRYEKPDGTAGILAVHREETKYGPRLPEIQTVKHADGQEQKIPLLGMFNDTLLGYYLAAEIRKAQKLTQEQRKSDRG